MGVILVAEAGNSHFGDLEEAKRMIHVAKQCGADAIKFQAFEAKDVMKFGSMPESFYEHVAFSVEDYLELVEVGALFNMPVFFSTFSDSMKKLWGYTFFHKVSAKQSPTFVFNKTSDKNSTFVSVNPDYGKLPELREAAILYATPYLPKEPQLTMIGELTEHYGRQVGYSDHTIGIDACIEAVYDHGANVVEKHFTLNRDFKWEGLVFRDNIHAADPKELE